MPEDIPDLPEPQFDIAGPSTGPALANTSVQIDRPCSQEKPSGTIQTLETHTVTMAATQLAPMIR